MSKRVKKFLMLSGWIGGLYFVWVLARMSDEDELAPLDIGGEYGDPIPSVHAGR